MMMRCLSFCSRVTSPLLRSFAESTSSPVAGSLGKRPFGLSRALRMVISNPRGIEHWASGSSLPHGRQLLYPIIGPTDACRLELRNDSITLGRRRYTRGDFLAMFGPFDSNLNGGPVRLIIYWVGAVLIGLALYGAAFKIIARWVAPGTLCWWSGLVVATLLASVPHMFTTRAVALWLWLTLANLDLSAVLWYKQTVAIGLVAMLGAALVISHSVKIQNGKPPSPIARAALPLFGTDVLALQMEDHYLRVHRAQGSELVLIALGEAIERVGSTGCGTRRSWWVARHPVAGVDGNARSMRLHLSKGLIAPSLKSTGDWTLISS